MLLIAFDLQHLPFINHIFKLEKKRDEKMRQIIEETERF